MKTCPKCGVEYADTTTLCPADGVALETTDDSLVGQTLAGKYRIDERLNEGGMGTVYRGTHVLMDKTVAIKVLRPSLAADEKIVARFSREARAASRISHPNALSVTDFGEDEKGIVFLVMEYLSGKTLKRVIREEGPMPLKRVVDIMRQVSDALHAAHSQGVVHRDLKSDNIMLVTTGVGEHAKVLDFGIAKIIEPEGKVDPDLTAPNLVIGTPQYMSPEQCSHSGEIDARSDIYSCGVILFEMLAGHVPFTGESPTMIMLKQMQEPVPSILEERPDLPPTVGRVIARAMAKLPSDRYQTVSEFLEDLTIAGGMIIGHEVPTKARQASTVSQPVDDADEVTVVRPRQTVPINAGRHAVQVPIAAAHEYETAGPTSFNPLKIIIPSAVALLAIFAVIYAFTRNGDTTKVNPNSSQQEPALNADPNSRPVEVAQPATGKAEEGIPAGGPISVPANTNVNTNLNANISASPSSSEEFNPSPSANENSNASRKATALPSPTKQATPEDVPVPSPPAVKSPAPKASPQAPTSSPTVPAN